MVKIFAVSTDSSLRDTFSHGLGGSVAQGFSIRVINSVDELTEVVRREVPDLILVDIVDCTSNHACRRIRSIPALARVPLLCLVEQCSAQDVAAVLDAGGDDCVRKPVIARELAARVRALLRRANRSAKVIPLVIDEREKSVLLYGSYVELTPTEYDLLRVLCQNPGQPLSATDLLERVWNYPPGVGDPALVRNHVRNLRRKLERDPNRPRIVTSSHGRGYTVSISAERR